MRMKLESYHFLLSYFKTPSDGQAGVELTTSHMAARCSTNWVTDISKGFYSFVGFFEVYFFYL